MRKLYSTIETRLPGLKAQYFVLRVFFGKFYENDTDKILVAVHTSKNRAYLERLAANRYCNKGRKYEVL